MHPLGVVRAKVETHDHWPVVMGLGSPLRFGRDDHWVERRTNLRLQQTTTGCDPLFPIVIYNEPRNLRAYGDSDRFWRNERNAHFGETKSTRFGESNFVVAERKS